MFARVVQANRKINTLLGRRFTPDESYRRATRALAFATALRRQFPGRTIPLIPQYEPDKGSADVYRVLLTCRNAIHSIAPLLAPKKLTMEINVDVEGSVSPSDVYDIASLLVTELQYLHAQFGEHPVRVPPFSVADKTPSDVHRRGRLLLSQPIDILEQLGRDPDHVQLSQAVMTGFRGSGNR